MKAAEGAFITLIPEKNVHLKPLKSNPFYSIKTHNKKLENSSAFELGTCKYCGAPFLIGKIDVLDLNVAQSERDQAKQKYINTLSNFWRNYYQMRSITLYDLETKQPLKADFELLLK